MFGILSFVAAVASIGVYTVSGNVTQCYHCNSLYCGDPYDYRLGAIASCSDVFQNAKLYSSRIISSGSSSGVLNSSDSFQFGSDNTEDIETVSSQDTAEIIRKRTHAEIFDIQRKIWEFFNKGEIDANTQFVCVKASYYNENSQTKTYRGCVPKYTKTISTACDFVNQKVLSSTASSTVYGCTTCENNLCNSGISLKTSFLVLVVGIILKVVI